MKNEVFELASMTFPLAIPRSYMCPAEWAEKNIVFSHAKDPIKGALDLSLSPYMIDPLNSFELEKGQGQKEITVVAPEQMGKTLIWICGLCWFMEYNPGLSLIYYTSDDKAEKVNAEKVEPVLRNIPKYGRLLDLPLSKNAECYRLGDNLIYFAGIGARVSSFTARLAIADETDDWIGKRGTDSIEDLRKRSRAFPESIFYKGCTPKGTDKQSKIWKEFLRSSMGYYFLRCLRCGALSMRSCDVNNLQWELDANDEVIEDSIRLICPACKHWHIEEEKRRMILDGGYIHKRPDRLLNVPGYQFGALASQLSAFAWLKIANAQLAAGRTGTLEKQIYFDNSVKGKPFRSRQIDDTGITALKKHQAPLPEPSTLLYRFLAADTQANCFYYVVRGVDAKSNTYLLAEGKANTTAELETVWRAEYHGGKIKCGIIDEGGHRSGEVRKFCEEHPGCFSYKGNPRIGVKFKLSEECKTLILANPRIYHDSLLNMIYASIPADNHYWYLPPDLSDSYKEQLTAWKANPSVVNGDHLENYYCPSENDHLFDAEKMMLVILDFFVAKILPLLLAAMSRKSVRV